MNTTTITGTSCNNAHKKNRKFLVLIHCIVLFLLHFRFLVLIFIFSKKQSSFCYLNITTLRSGIANLSVVYLSSVTLVQPTQPVEIFRSVSTPFCTIVIH